MSARIWLKRAYDRPAGSDGNRVLVDRIWPRGVSKEDADIDIWLKDVAPSTDLRKWFAHDPDKWDRMKERYREELRHGKPRDAFEYLSRLCKDGRVTLVFAAKDREHNQAVILKELLE